MQRPPVRQEAKARWAKRTLLGILAAATLGFSGCSATNLVTLTVTEPAPVTVPPHMKRIGIIDRSQPAGKDALLDKLDKVFSAEGKNLDKDAAAKSIEGLREELERNARFEAVVLVEVGRLENPSFGVFPGPLSAGEVEEICRNHNLDGLFSLEFFDTDANIEYSSKQVMVKGPLGVEVPTLMHYASVTTRIKTGWRIYDAHSRRVLDEYLDGREVQTVGSGINPVEAAKALTGRKEAVNSASYQVGQSYAISIIPYRTRVSRKYYVRGSDALKAAKRKAQTGNWDGAAELWQQETEHPKPKVAARAHYNMAISSEINGDLDRAMEWAARAYEDYGNKLALDYLQVLKARKARLETLRLQQE